MGNLKLSLENLNNVFPDNFTNEQIADAKTLFLKKRILSKKDSKYGQS